LRERGEDIPFLVGHFLGRYAKEMDKEAVEASAEVMEVLTQYPWPGNVRELQNVLRRTLALMRHQVIALEDLPDEIVARAGESPARQGKGFFNLRERRLAAFEIDYLRSLLNACRGDMTCAAREAQLPRGTLYRLLKKHNLNPGDFRSGSDPGVAI
jgi:DNA-binding NtrC family response regulator